MFPAREPGTLAQLVERLLDTQEVTGSNPVWATAYAGINGVDHFALLAVLTVERWLGVYGDDRYRHGEMQSLMCSGRHTYLANQLNADELPVLLAA